MKKTSNAKGFTVIELLVATVVFGVVLLVVTTAVIQITRMYYKGLTESRTQDVARTLVDRITQSIQFNGGDVMLTLPPSGGTQFFCVGDQQYSYVLGRQVVDGSPNADQTRHAMVVRDLAGCFSGSPMPNMSAVNPGGRELLSPHMRLAKMSVQAVGSTGLYKVSVKVVYGDQDLLEDATNASARCKSIQNGNQFCAVSEITTVVAKRVN